MMNSKKEKKLQKKQLLPKKMMANAQLALPKLGARSSQMMRQNASG